MRGLKSINISQYRYGAESHPVRGAWIEISYLKGLLLLFVSHPVRGAWIEILDVLEIRVNGFGRIP